MAKAGKGNCPKYINEDNLVSARQDIRCDDGGHRHLMLRDRRTEMSGELLGQDIVYYIGGRQAADGQGGLIYKLTRFEDAV